MTTPKKVVDANDRANKILNEQDPFLREIWAAGYDEVIESPIMDGFMLVRNQDNFKKHIKRIDLMFRYKIKTALLYSGETHRWLSEADGSVERFRKLIEPN